MRPAPHPNRLARVLLAGALVVTGCARPTPNRVARSFDPDSVPEAFARSTAALMWPGATRAWQITPEGDLYNGAWCVRLLPSAGPAPAGAPRAVAFEERWLPVAHWRRTSGDVRWDFEAVALPGPGERDSGLIASLCVTATNLGSHPLAARLVARLEPPRHPAFVAFDAPETPADGLRMGTAASGVEVHGWWDGPRERGTAPDSVALAWTLAPRAARDVRFLFPTYPATERSLARWAEPPHERRAAEARRYWNAEAARGALFSLGDAETESALEAARVTLLALRERRGAVWVPIANPFQYRDVWLRDGARAIRALAVLGHTREARELCAGFEGLQWPGGGFLSQRGQLDGTGQALWTFEQALLRPAPDDSIRRYANEGLRAWRWLEWQRENGSRAGWEFGEMLPFGDPRDAEVTRAQLVGNDAWALAGYHAAARLLAAAGERSQSREIEDARARYLAGFESALAHTGSSDLPPSWQGTGRDWGNLAVVTPCGVLPAGAPRAAALARRVWAAAGGAGLATYGPRDTLQYYYGADLGEWALLAGERAAADSVLEAMLHWRTASGCAAELFSRTSRDYGTNLPPHGTGAAAIASLVRDALLSDDGDTLRLTLGARARWWSGSSVRRAPTYWGLLDLEFRRTGDAAAWRWSGVPVWTALTLPPGTRLAGPPAAPLVRGPADDIVLAPPGTREARVRVEGRAP